MKILLLSIPLLFSFFAMAEDTQKSDQLFGTWDFLEVTLHPKPDLGLGPFPKSINIESIEENQGKLTIQLRTQSKTKNYLFSTTTNPTPINSVQVYDKPDQSFDFKPYTLEEKASISYSENNLKVDLVWTRKDAEGNVKSTVHGSYLFTFDGEKLQFTRTNGVNDPEKNLTQMVVKAIYQRTQKD